MMQIDIVAVGKIKEKYLNKGIQEYLKRLQAYAKVRIHEVADEATAESMSQKEIDQLLEVEASRINHYISNQHTVIVLAIEGDLISSEELASKIENYATYGQSKLCFLIGGSLGLAESLKRKADWRVSFGRITLPHQLMRLVLLEQIYRAYRIINHQPYHK